MPFGSRIAGLIGRAEYNRFIRRKAADDGFADMGAENGHLN